MDQSIKKTELIPQTVEKNSHTIVVMGLGYVGLPLAVKLAEHYTVIGYDVNEPKIEELRRGYDRMCEVSDEDLKATSLTYSTDPSCMEKATIIIVALPTPIDNHNNPDISLLKIGSKAVGKHIRPGTIVVYESTVYPGLTEDVCQTIIEEESGLTCNKDFFLGYSPERINPGDQNRTIDKIVKVVAGSTPETTDTLAEVYGSIITAGIHKAPSIKVAEAAKVIENVQRDLNIALINELAVLFAKMDIDVHDVLDAAATKWNFHKYTPGLVGGHCIGVDPYYLTYKAEEVGHHPELILAGRRINDGMHRFYARKIIGDLNRKGIATSNARIGVLGLTFKENCSDQRNSRAKYLIDELRSYGVTVFGVDPWLETEDILKFGAQPRTVEQIMQSPPDGIVVTVPHAQFFDLDFRRFPVVLDIKGQILRSRTE